PPILRQVVALLLLVTVALLAMPQAAPAQSVLKQLVTPPEDQQAVEAEPAALSPDQTQLIADLLRDEAAREALIAELERLAAERAGETPPAAGEPTDPAVTDLAAIAEEAAAEEDTSFGREIAQRTQAIAQDVATSAGRLWQRLARVPALFSSLERVETGFLLDALTELAFVIITTAGLFVILRWQARRLYRWMGRRSKPLGFAGRAALYVGSLILDAGIVLVAWGAGYALAVTLFGEFGQIAIRQTLYLNAFLAVEMVKVGMRAVLSPAVGELRPVHVGDEGARRTYRVLNVVTSIIGYGQLLVVPVVAEQVGYFPGRSVSALLLLVALVTLGWAVVRNRHVVSDWMCSGLEKSTGPQSRFWRTLARFWWVPVLVYLAAVFIIVLVQPGDVLLPVLWGSARILIAAAIGWMVAGLIGLAISRGVRLPAAFNRRLPMLERRLNAFVPRVLFVLRIVILLAVVAYTLHVAGLFDADGWLDSAAGVWLTGTALSVALILLVTFSIWITLASWVDYRLNPDFGTVPTARESTLLTLLRNAVTITLVAITLMFVLSEIGVDIAPLIASAGIVGLAIGFGAQKMVQDIITGVFIQLENAINVGDVVAAGGISGVVERLTIRSVSLRDLDGVYHIIPFSSVDTVSNFMREFAFALLEMRIAYRVDVGVAKEALFDAFEELREDPDV
ncbi:MAG TPA: mechanosensitive ion channel domain-containing protein, partial [Paracoccaceae bacterium]|nr:mechanosensitive ion channel domain-containing protein [Paracoccaceae bacterium]